MPHQAHTRHIWCRTHTFSRPSARCLASCKKCKCNRRLRDPRPTSEPAGHGLTANPEKYHPESGFPSTSTHPSRVLPQWRIALVPCAALARFEGGDSERAHLTREKQQGRSLRSASGDALVEGAYGRRLSGRGAGKGPSSSRAWPLRDHSIFKKWKF